MPRPIVPAQLHRVETTTFDTFTYAASLDEPATPLRAARCCCGWNAHSGSAAGLAARVRGHLEAVASTMLADLDDAITSGDVEPPLGD